MISNEGEHLHLFALFNLFGDVFNKRRVRDDPVEFDLTDCCLPPDTGAVFALDGEFTVTAYNAVFTGAAITVNDTVLQSLPL